jgi:hypothetical protein
VLTVNKGNVQLSADCEVSHKHCVSLCVLVCSSRCCKASSSVAVVTVRLLYTTVVHYMCSSVLLTLQYVFSIHCIPLQRAHWCYTAMSTKA